MGERVVAGGRVSCRHTDEMKTAALLLTTGGAWLRGGCHLDRGAGGVCMHCMLGSARVGRFPLVPDTALHNVEI